MKFIGESYSLYAKDIHQIWCRFANCENQNCVQNQDQDQDHDMTLDFNTRPTFHTLLLLLSTGGPPRPKAI